MSYYVRDLKEVSPMFSDGPCVITNQTTVNVFFETDIEVIKKILPPPLEAMEDAPYAIAYGGQFGDTNCGPGYRELALCVQCKYKDIEGSYVVTIPVDGDMGMLTYRDVIGYPKKMANIVTEFSDEGAYCSAERYGVKFMEIEAKFDGVPNDPAGFMAALGVIGRANDENGMGMSFAFKAQPSATGVGFEYTPRLYGVRNIKFDNAAPKIGSANVIFRELKHDPVFEFPIKKVLGAVCTYTDHELYKDKTTLLAEVPAEEYMPYAFNGYDFPPIFTREDK